jgi:putative oxidoreductase
VLAVLAEFVCAVLVVVGFATRFAAVPVVVTMAVAAFVVHGSDPWSMGEAARRFMAGESKSWASKEPALLFLIPFLALVFTGAGKFSVDGLIRRHPRPS